MGGISLIVLGVLLFLGGIGSVLEPEALSKWPIFQSFHYSRQQTAARVGGVLLCCLGLGIAAYPMLLPFYEEMQEVRYMERIERGEHMPYVEEVCAGIKEDGDLEVFPGDYEFEYFIYSLQTLQAVYVNFEGGYMTESSPEALSKLIRDGAYKAWSMPANYNYASNLFEMEEVDDLHNSFILDMRPLPELDRADLHLAMARESWEKGDKKAALKHATEACWIKSEHLGDDHPSTQEIKKMIESAR